MAPVVCPRLNGNDQGPVVRKVNSAIQRTVIFSNFLNMFNSKAQIKIQDFRVTFYLLQVPFPGVIVFYAFLWLLKKSLSDK